MDATKGLTRARARIGVKASQSFESAAGLEWFDELLGE